MAAIFDKAAFSQTIFGKHAPAFASTIKRIESSTLVDFNFAKSKTYGGAGQIITDLIGGVTATLGAGDTASTDDPTILYAGTPQGKAKFDGGDLLKLQAAFQALSDSAKTTIDQNYYVTFAFKMPDTWDTTKFLLLTSSGTNGLNFYVNGSRRLYFNQSQGASNEQVFVTDFELGKFYVLTIGWNPSSNEVVAKVNNASLTVLGNTFVAGSGESDITAEFFKLFSNTTENYRIAFGAGGDLMDNTRATAIYNQLVTDHQKPFVFPTADSLVNTQAACVLDLDATLYNSFPDLDSQHWIDTVAGNKFTLGNTTAEASNDPVFSGGIGESDAAFMSDGSTFFDIASNPSYLQDAHKTTGGQDITFLAEIFVPDATLLTRSLINTSGSGNGHGFSVNISDALTAFRHYNGSTHQTNLPALTKGEWNTVAIKFSAANEILDYSFNGTAWISASSPDFGATTTDASTTTKLMWLIDDGFEIRSFSIYDKLLSDTELTAELAKLEARHT